MNKININGNDKSTFFLGSEILYSDRIVFNLPKEINTWKVLITLIWKERLNDFKIKVEYINQNETVLTHEFEKGHLNVLFIYSDSENALADSLAISSTINAKTEFEMIVQEFNDINEYIDSQNIPDEQKEIQKEWYKNN